MVKKGKNDNVNSMPENTKKTKLKKIINIIEYTIILLIISVNAILVIKSVKNPNKTPDLFGKKAFIIVSGSMIPTIQIGDVVVIQDSNSANTGEIIAFRRDTNVIVHRVIKEMNVNGKTMYQTQGDNNNTADLELVDMQNIEGVYITKIPWIGNVLMFVYNNLAFVVVVIVLILIVKYFFD